MKRLLIRQYRRYRELVLYGVIGVSGAALDLCLYALLAVGWSVAPWFATIISSTVGSINNYLLNARYNFRTNDRHAARFAAYYGVSALGVVGHAAGVYLMHNMAGAGVMTSKLLVAIPIVLGQYLLNSRFTFADARARRTVAPASPDARDTA